MTYWVKSEGIRLPDGTVWGAETKEALRVVRDEFRRSRFHVYEIIGEKAIEKEPGAAWEWKEMRALVSEFVNHQLSIGNRVFDNNGEIKEFTLTTETYC